MFERIKKIISIYDKPRLILSSEFSEKEWLVAIVKDLTFLEDLPEKFKTFDFYNQLFNSLEKEQFGEINFNLIDFKFLTNENLEFIIKDSERLDRLNIDLNDLNLNIEQSKLLIKNISEKRIYKSFNIYKDNKEELILFHLNELLLKHLEKLNLSYFNLKQYKYSYEYSSYCRVISSILEELIFEFNSFKKPEEIFKSIFEVLYAYNASEDLILSMFSNIFDKYKYKEKLENTPEICEIVIKLLNENPKFITYAFPFIKVNDTFRFIENNLDEISKNEFLYENLKTYFHKSYIPTKYYNVEVISKVANKSPYLLNIFLKNEEMFVFLFKNGIFTKTICQELFSEEKIQDENKLDFSILVLYYVLRTINNKELSPFDNLCLDNFKDFIYQDCKFILNNLNIQNHSKTHYKLILSYVTEKEFKKMLFRDITTVSKYVFWQYNFETIYSIYPNLFSEDFLLDCFNKNLILVNTLKEITKYIEERINNG